MAPTRSANGTPPLSDEGKDIDVEERRGRIWADECLTVHPHARWQPKPVTPIFGGIPTACPTGCLTDYLTYLRAVQQALRHLLRAIQRLVQPRA